MAKSLLNKFGFGHHKQQWLTLSPNIPSQPSFEPYDNQISELYRYRKHIGVNLGSLFVLESWLCPSALKNAVKGGHWSSEYDFIASCHDHQEARELLEHHWTSFITTRDIEILREWGINAVRIPIGYWMVEPRSLLLDHPRDCFHAYADVYDAAFGLLLQLIRACEQNKIGCLIDIHGAPGGQNTDSHCGQPTSNNKARLFATSLSSTSNASILLTILHRLTELLSPINNIIGIEILNEPTDNASLPGFYERACQTVVQATPPGQHPLPVYIGDSWKPSNYMDIIAHQLSRKKREAHPFIVLDTHQYFCHTPQDHRLSAQQHTDKVENKIGPFLLQQGASIRNNIVVGEWSMVLNGASMKGMDERSTMTAFGETQARVWDKTCAGQFYWTYKTADDKWYWSMIYCQQQGLLPWLKRTEQRSLPPLDEETVKHQIETHLTYWRNQQADYQAIEQHVWMFEKGFRKGYQVALQFRQNASHVGFPSQLAKDYQVEEQWSDKSTDAFTWQYEQGFIQAISIVESKS
ncbi:glycoside hydrolase superfamily [Halteromyces radiatus]|uniref:glycoside hydrolase superfamily n=1 Tax=Halteromyces radiatus TaxID=101107 RepID=UPI0022206B6A|nr:glycoside hydrolase superfamily [Halteromyces radiatus]KAI8096976.1 glycoside hydrolase superfamily [Halteromyces radiatus]